MPPVSIRPFAPEYLDAVHALYDAARPYGLFKPDAHTGDALRLVAVASSGAIVGYGSASGGATSNLKLVIHPDWQRQGIGSALWDHMRADLIRHETASMRVWVREESAAAVAWLSRHGFVQIEKDGPVNLALPADLTPFAAVEADVATRGIVITSLAAERERDPDCLAKLHALYIVVEADVPRDEAYAPPSLDDCTRWWSAPDAHADGFFFAIDNGRYVGLSQVGPRSADPYFEPRTDLAQQGLTGTLPEYRRQGVATALKLHVVRYAQDRGYRQLWTNSTNPAMKALNRKMGFRTGPWLIYSLGLRPHGIMMAP